MEKIVSLARRRGFVFPASEIYGGLASSYDYGHYGVLLKDNVKARWLEAMVRERDDIVALDSSIILNPRVWEASGHVGGFSDPLVDCRTCKQRFRADHLADPEHDEVRCGKRPSKRPGETPDCDLTEPRQFNLMFQTRVGAVEETGVDVYLRPETAQGIFVNFKNVAQLARRKPPFGIAQIGKAFRNEITPGNFIFRTLEFEQMEMEFFVPPAEADEWYRYWVAERVAWHVRFGIRDREPPRPRARRRRALALLERHERHRVPLPHRLVGARGDREPRRLRPHPAHGGLGDEARMGRLGQRRAVRAARDRAGARRQPLDARLPRRRLRRGGRRRAGADGPAAPPPARARQGGRPAADREGRGDGRDGARPPRGAPPAHERRVRRQRRDRPPVPPPGRDRHPVGADGRRADRGRRHRHAARPRLARPGAAARRVGSRPAARAACTHPGPRPRAGSEPARG